MTIDNTNKGTALDDAGDSLGDAAAPPSNVRLSETLTLAELKALLARRDVQARIRQIVTARVNKRAPRTLVDDLYQDANVAAITSKSLPASKETAPGWLAMVAARTVALHFRRKAAERKWLEHDAEVEVDGLESPPEDAKEDEEGDGKPSWLLGEWLAPLVAQNARDQETYELLVYKARTGESHEQVAEEHAMTTAALKNRLHKFKAKYQPQWQRHKALRRRNLFVVLFLLGLAVAAVVAWLLGRPHRAPISPGTPSYKPDTPFYAPDRPLGVSHPRPSGSDEDKPKDDKPPPPP